MRIRVFTDLSTKHAVLPSALMQTREFNTRIRDIELLLKTRTEKCTAARDQHACIICIAQIMPIFN